MIKNLHLSQEDLRLLQESILNQEMRQQQQLSKLKDLLLQNIIQQVLKVLELKLMTKCKAEHKIMVLIIIQQ